MYLWSLEHANVIVFESFRLTNVFAISLMNTQELD